MSLLHEDGQLLIDSSDISYLYEEGINQPSDYYGEVRYLYEYKGSKGQWFDWIYIDQEKLVEITNNMGLKMEILHTAETDQYLCCITK